MKTWHPRLHVYLAWHPDAAPALGEELAAAIAQRISRDTTRPFDRDIGIPVFFHSAAPEGEPTPPSIDWDQALQTVVVVLIEGTMLRDHAWVEHVRAVYKEALGQNKHHLLPIGLAKDAGAEAEAREATASLLVYPEPPVSEAEQRARSHHTRVRIATPLTLHRGSLKGMTLGISISGGDEETSAADLGRHGLTQEHLDAALFAFSRHAVAHGATIAYGGDLRPGGFTENLFEYLHACKAAGLEDFERVRNYLAWPLHLRIDRDWWGLNMGVVELREMPLPEDLLQAGIDPEQFLPPDGPENRYLWARCLTLMRRTMAREIHARILACGKWTNYLGRLPGLMEEALLALEEDTPLFLLGGFGGVTEMLIEALRGKHPVPLTEA